MSAKDVRLYFLVQTAAAALKKNADELLYERTGLSTAQTAALAIIHGQGPLSMRELADALLQRESAMTTMVRRLEKKRLVERERSETDKREWQISLTQTGKDGLMESREAFAEINTALDGAFSGAEMRSLANNLMTLRALFSSNTSE